MYTYISTCLWNLYNALDSMLNISHPLFHVLTHPSSLLSIDEKLRPKYFLKQFTRAMSFQI